MQRMGEGQSYAVPTSYYSIKVGDNIRLFLTNKKDWTEFTDAAAKAYIRKIQNEYYYEFMNGATQMPVPSKLHGTGTLDQAAKTKFDEIITMVESVNEVNCVIMGTKTALKNLNGLYVAGNGVNWIAPSQKEAVAHSGILGDYEGTILVEIPQRYEDKDLVNNAKPMVPNNILIIMPMVDNKPIKFVDYGETELDLATKQGDTVDDMQQYELNRRMGIATLMTRYYGVWEI